MFLVEEYRTNNQEGIYFNRDFLQTEIDFFNRTLRDCVYSIGKNKLNFPEGIFKFESTGMIQIEKISQTIKFLIKHNMGLDINGKICLTYLSETGSEEYLLIIKDSIPFVQERLFEYSKPEKI